MASRTTKRRGQLPATLEGCGRALLLVVRQEPRRDGLQAELWPRPEQRELPSRPRSAISDLQLVPVKRQFQRLRAEPERLVGLSGQHRAAGQFHLDAALHEAEQLILAGRLGPQTPAPYGRE